MRGQGPGSIGNGLYNRPNCSEYLGWRIDSTAQRTERHSALKSGSCESEFPTPNSPGFVQRDEANKHDRFSAAIRKEITFEGVLGYIPSNCNAFDVESSRFRFPIRHRNWTSNRHRNTVKLLPIRTDLKMLRGVAARLLAIGRLSDIVHTLSRNG